MEKLYTLKQSADILGVKLGTIKKWVYYDNKLKVVKVGGHAVRITESELKSIITAKDDK